MRRIADASKTLKASNGYERAKALEVQNMLLTAEMLIVGSIERKESRGAFFRHDYPKLDNANWLKNIISSQVNGELSMRTEAPEMRYVKPDPGRAGGKQSGERRAGFGGEVV